MIIRNRISGIILFELVRIIVDRPQFTAHLLDFRPYFLLVVVKKRILRLFS